MNDQPHRLGEVARSPEESLGERTTRLRAELAALEHDLDHAQRGCPRDAADIAASRQAAAELGRAIMERKRALADVVRAGERARAGLLGRCDRCGETIDPQRMAAIPTASTCLECASEDGSATR